MKTREKLSNYRREYKEHGLHDNCGDWLAVTLDDLCTVVSLDSKGRKRKSMDLEKFDALLDVNGVERTGKWAELPTSGQRGWRGRYRMNGRQKLEPIVAGNGYLWESYPGSKIVAPPEWCAMINRRKRW